jgi:hypothetical protein
MRSLLSVVSHRLSLPPAGMKFCGLQASCYVNVLYNWQTLIGGIVAIGAAIYAGRYVKKQINISERIEDNRLDRRANAVRAILPLTLTKFIDFAEGCTNTIRRIQGPSFGPPSGVMLPMQAPQIPQQAINDLERAIEATRNDLAVEIMTRLAGHSQVLHSIINDLVVEVNARGNALRRVDPNMPSFKIRTARVHAAASTLFSWARGETEAPEQPTWDHIATSLALLNIDDDATIGLINRNREINSEPFGW